MSLNNTHKKTTSRRGFFKKLILGTGGLAFANSLREYLIPGKRGAIAAQTETSSLDASIYGKYLLGNNGKAPKVNGLVSFENLPNTEGKTSPQSHLEDVPELSGITASIGWQVFTAPVCWENPHTHRYDEFLIFLGMESSALNSSLDAKIDLWMGAEMEKHTITSATMVFIPKGVQHAPLNFREIRKPVLFHSSPVHLP